jgi:TonB family protein
MKVNILAILLLLLLFGCDSLSTDQSGPEPDPIKPQLLEKEPSLVNLDEIRESIGYPGIAREAEIEGTVKVRILIDEEGNYVRHITLQEGHPALLKAVSREIPRLQCNPAIQDGKPVKSWITIPFPFYLGNR